MPFPNRSADSISRPRGDGWAQGEEELEEQDQIMIALVRPGTCSRNHMSISVLTWR